MTSTWYLRSEGGPIFGPAHIDVLREWAEQGRIGPDSLVSADRVSWAPAYTRPELEMDWMVDGGVGAESIGPINLKALRDLLLDGSVGSGASLVNRHSRETLPLYKRMDDIFARPTPTASTLHEQPTPPPPAPVIPPELLERHADLETRPGPAAEQSARNAGELHSALLGREDDRRRLEAKSLDFEMALRQARAAQSTAETEQYTASAKAQETEKRLSESNAISEGLRHELDDAKKQLAETQQQLAKVRQQLAEAQQQLAEAQQMLRTSEADTREKEQRHQSNAEHWRVAQSELRKTLQATQIKLASEAEARAQVTSNAANRERLLLADIERLKHDVEALGENTVRLNLSLEAASDRLAAESQEAEQRTAEQTRKIECLTAEQKSISASSAQVTEALAAARRQQEVDRSRAAQREADLSRQLTTVTQRAETLQSEVQQLNAEAIDMKRRNDADIVATSARMTAQQSRIRELEEAATARELEIANVRHLCSAAQSKATAAESEALQKLAVLEPQIAERNDYATRCEQTIHDLQAELRQVSEDRDQLKVALEARREAEQTAGNANRLRETMLDQLHQLAVERAGMKTLAEDLRLCLSLQHSSRADHPTVPPPPPAPPFPAETLKRLEELLTEKDNRIRELELRAEAGRREAPPTNTALPKQPTATPVKAVHEPEILPPSQPVPPVTSDEETTKKAFRPLDTTLWTGVFTRRTSPRDEEKTKKAANLADIEAQAHREILAWRKGQGSTDRQKDNTPG